MFRKPCLPRFWLYHPDYWIFRNYCAEIHLGDGVVSSLHGPFHINWLSTTRSWAGGCNQKYNAQKNLVEANSEAYTSISMATQNTRKPNYTFLQSDTHHWLVAVLGMTSGMCSNIGSPINIVAVLGMTSGMCSNIGSPIETRTRTKSKS